jgi:hypothetical protein
MSPTTPAGSRRARRSLSGFGSAKEPRHGALALFHGADLQRRGEPQDACPQRDRGGTQKGARRCDRAASSGAGSAPDSTGVSPSGACRAILLPAIASSSITLLSRLIPATTTAASVRIPVRVHVPGIAFSYPTSVPV